MPYKKLKIQKMTEGDLRELWKNEYCSPNICIKTFDGIHVKFYEDMFDHAFFESADRKAKDKSILSLNRLEKMLWIKETLQDENAILKEGWDRKNRTYINSRRLALIKDNYIVIIRLTGKQKAKFLTAYEVNNENNLTKIKNSPDWTKK